MTAEASTQDLLPAELTMGTVMLKVGDMKVMTDYYQRALGLDIVAEQDGGLYLGPASGKPLVHLAPAPGLNLSPCGEAGLFTPPCCSMTSRPSPRPSRPPRSTSRSPSPAVPTTSSARPSTSMTPKVTASSSTGTGPAMPGLGMARTS